MAAAYWVAQVELILHTAEISESVPLIAALASAFALVGVNKALVWLRDRGIAVGHYFFAGIILGIVAYFFPHVLGRVEVINFD